MPDRPTAVQVHIELRDADGIWQSFLILPGQERLMTLVGFVDNANGWQRITLPVNVRARVV